MKKECSICKKEFETAYKRVHTCSKNCYKKYRFGYFKKIKKKKRDFVVKYKESKGCSICGYNKCGASLDYHHQKGKDFSVDAWELYSFLKNGNERVKKELKKCILVCKNCHYELHYRENN